MIIKFLKDSGDYKAGILYDIPLDKKTHTLISLGVAFEPEDALKQYRQQQERSKVKVLSAEEKKRADEFSQSYKNRDGKNTEEHLNKTAKELSIGEKNLELLDQEEQPIQYLDLGVSPDGGFI